MPFKNFTSEVLTSSDVDTYLMRQGVMTFATSAARDSALSGVLDEGMVAFLEDTDSLTYYTGSAWRTWTSGAISYSPTITASGGSFAVGNGTLTGTYRYAGGLTFAQATLTWGSAGTNVGSGNWQVSLPVTATTGPEGGRLIVNDGGTAFYQAGIYYASSTLAVGLFGSTTANQFSSGTTPVATPSSGDTWVWSLHFTPA